MVRLNCHSAWQHYEMFHSRGGDVINIGSNNTTIFNMGGGFGSGNFWSGVGFGIGNSLGSIFGGLFGGSMNPYYCNYANPFSFMNPYSMIAGGGARPSKNDDKNCTCHCKDKPSNDKTCNDPDQKKLLELGKEVNDLKANDKSTKQDAEALLNKLKDAKKASEKEGHHDDTDPGQFQNWIDNLTAHMKAKGWLDGQETKVETKPDANKANAEIKKEPWSNISAWNNDTGLIPRHITLPDGYSKLDPNETIENIDRVHDNSGKTDDVKGDTKKSTETYKAQGKDTTFPKYLAITTKVNNTYNYKIIGMSNGYPIYGTPQSDKNKNVYVMCKEKSTGKVVLLQFEYKPEKTDEKIEKMSGYGVKDTQN